MTEDNERLIEAIRTTNVDSLKGLIEVLQIEDPLQRLQTLEEWDDSALSAWALAQAKAVTIGDLRRSTGSSLKDIGELLGVSRQRVHQLANPKPRRSPECQMKK